MRSRSGLGAVLAGSAVGRAILDLFSRPDSRGRRGRAARCESHAMRPRVNVQWGKHGSMPFGWESMSIVGDAGDLERAYYTVGKPIALAEYNRGTWQKLQTDGPEADRSPARATPAMARSFHRHLGALCRFFTAGRSCRSDQGREPDERVALEQRGHQPALSCVQLQAQDRVARRTHGRARSCGCAAAETRRSRVTRRLPAATQDRVRSRDAAISERLVLSRHRACRLVRRGGAAGGRSTARADALAGGSRSVRRTRKAATSRCGWSTCSRG